MAYLCGKWRWHDIVPCSSPVNTYRRFKISFKFDGLSCIGFQSVEHYDGTRSIVYMKDDTTNYAVVNSSYDNISEMWVFTFYRGHEVDFGAIPQEIDDDFYNFFVANADPLDTIADKLQYIAENEQRVYDKGYQVGNDAGYDEGLEVGYEDGFGKGKAEGYQEGLVSSEAYEKGKQAEYDAFWDAYQLNGNRGIYEAAFAGQGWNDKTFNPKYPIVVTGSSWNMFYSCNVKDGYEILKNVDFSKCTVLSSAFAQCHMKHLGTIDCRNVKSVYNLFYHAKSLQTIDKIIVKVENTFSSLFDNTPLLENVTFEGEIGNDLVMAGTYSGTKWGDKLTRASIESIVTHLSDNVSGKTLTLSKTATENAFPDWNDWGALVMAHPNWTLELV